VPPQPKESAAAMMYVLAIFLPPVAVLLAGKPFQAVINILLCLLLWIPGVIHAIAVVASSQADARTKRVVKEMRRQHRDEMNALKGR
jgi:uncharacterized membrane protein YqaE (UPF0057 family)